VYVAIKGFVDIKQMLARLANRDPETGNNKPEEKK
jgi:hypothetical protein